MRDSTSALSAAATRAHLLLASHAAELADLAVSATRPDRADQDTGDHSDLIGTAQRILEAAVVAARLDGKTWAEIACTLDGATPQSARARYWPAVARSRTDPFPSQDSRRDGVPANTARTSFRLRQLPVPKQPDAPGRIAEIATGATPPPIGHLALVTRPAEQGETEGSAVDTRLKIAERLVAAYERIATNERRPPPWILDGLAHARRTAAELRARPPAPPAE